MRKVVIGNITCEVPDNHQFIWVDWYSDLFSDQPPVIVSHECSDVHLATSKDKTGSLSSITLDFEYWGHIVDCNVYMGLHEHFANDLKGKLFRILDNGELELVAVYSPL